MFKNAIKCPQMPSTMMAYLFGTLMNIENDEPW